MNNTLHTIIILCSFYAITFIAKQSILFDKPRIWLIRKSVFFYYLFECWFCTGYWAGLIVYLLSFSQFDFREFILFGLAGASVSYIIDIVLQRLMRE